MLTMTEENTHNMTFTQDCMKTPIRFCFATTVDWCTKLNDSVKVAFDRSRAVFMKSAIGGCSPALNRNNKIRREHLCTVHLCILHHFNNHT
jgi:hypothetical protein